MPEVKALLTLAWRRSHRTAILYVAGILVLLAISFWFGESLAAADGLIGQWFGFLMLIVIFPAGVWGIFLLDFPNDGHVSERGSGFSHWLFRMPIETWKLAAIPIAIKTCWIAGVWFLLVLCLRNLGLETRWVMVLAVPFACIGIWVFALNWMSSRWRYGKVAFVFLLLPASVGAIGGSMAAIMPPGPAYGGPAVLVVGSVIYALSVVFAYRLLKVARINAEGIVVPQGDSAEEIAPPTRTGATLVETVRGAVAGFGGTVSVPRTHASASAALTWHDLAKSHAQRLKLLLIVVFPGALCGVMLGPLNGMVVVMSLGFIWISAVTSSSIVESCQKGTSTTLPPYVVASPLTSSQIAWSQMRASARTTSMIFVVLAITCLLLYLDSSRRAQWDHWAAGVASLPSVNGTATEVGLRYSAAWLIGLVVLMMVMPVRAEWISMTGRQWVAVLVGTISIGLIFGSICAVIGWFLVQTDYDSAWENALWWRQWLPHLVLGLCAVKLIVTAVVTVKLARASLVKPLSQLMIFGGWAMATVALATIFYLLIPDNRLGILTCLIVVGMFMPLASIQAMPLAVDWNRHR